MLRSSGFSIRWSFKSGYKPKKTGLSFPRPSSQRIRTNPKNTSAHRAAGVGALRCPTTPRWHPDPTQWGTSPWGSLWLEHVLASPDKTPRWNVKTGSQFRDPDLLPFLYRSPFWLSRNRSCAPGSRWVRCLTQPFLPISDRKLILSHLV